MGQYWNGERRSRYYGPHNWENGKYKVHGEEVFGSDYYCDFLIDFMERTAKQKRPFFAYFPMNLIHSPLITLPGKQESAMSVATAANAAGPIIELLHLVEERFPPAEQAGD